jgi:hypothetical protein
MILSRLGPKSGWVRSTLCGRIPKPGVGIWQASTRRTRAGLAPLRAHHAAEPAAPDGLTGVAPDWDEDPAVVPAILTQMQPVPLDGGQPPRSQGGRSSGKVFFLCSYRTSRPALLPDGRAIVTSVTFLPSPGGIRVRAYVCGEEIGRVF